MAGTTQEVASLKSSFKLDGIGKAIKDLRTFNKEMEKVKQSINKPIKGKGGTGTGSSDKAKDRRLAREELKDLKSQNRELKKKEAFEKRSAQRRNDKISRTMNRASVGKLAQNKGAMELLDDLSTNFRKGKMSAIEYDNAVNKVIRSHTRLGQSSASTSAQLHKLRTGFIALTAAATPFAGGMAVTETGRQFENLGLAFEVAFGDRASEKVKDFNKIVDETGVNIRAVMKGYKLFSVAAKESGFGEAAGENIFRAISKASVVYGSSAEDTEGTLRA